jgi:hypothetical protein
MKSKNRLTARVSVAGGLFLLLGVTVALVVPSSKVLADPHSWFIQTFCGNGEEPPSMEVGGTWYWMRSPEQEKRVVMALFNRYCIRCHGVDGRGVWDIPDVPNFTNQRWQASRTDGQLARAILEGRGSVMPPWRGTLSLEEAWAIARYVRTFVPGMEVSRPDFGTPETSGPLLQQPGPSRIPPAPAASPGMSRPNLGSPETPSPAIQQPGPAKAAPAPTASPGVSRPNLGAPGIPSPAPQQAAPSNPSPAP